MLAALAACSSIDRTPMPDATALSLPDATSIRQSGDLRITPLDILEINVYGVDDFDGTYQVDHVGRIKVPLIGEVNANSYTALELANLLETRLAESYLQSPDVTVRIVESRGEQITLEGSINSPGVYPVEGQLTLLQAIALGGGPSASANPRKVVIFRQIEGERHAAGFDLISIRNGEAEDPIVYGNDIIVMDGSEARAAYGDLLRTIPLLSFLLIL
ncbi:MAG: polysaccharide biosynthesis/export family protein [Henriciella sp.]|nr:polysaccharide biosynthesis/export family protein [Henriciella sp.]